jgi:hypothetical protein
MDPNYYEEPEELMPEHLRERASALSHNHEAIARLQRLARQVYFMYQIWFESDLRDEEFQRRLNGVISIHHEIKPLWYGWDEDWGAGA